MTISPPFEVAWTDGPSGWAKAAGVAAIPAINNVATSINRGTILADLFNLQSPLHLVSVQPQATDNMSVALPEGVRKCSSASGIMVLETHNRPQTRITQKMLLRNHPDRIHCFETIIKDEVLQNLLLRRALYWRHCGCYSPV